MRSAAFTKTGHRCVGRRCFRGLGEWSLCLYPWQRKRYWAGDVTESVGAHLEPVASVNPTPLGDLRGKLRNVPAGERASTLTSWLGDQLAAVLEIERPKLTAASRLSKLGLDSLKVIDLRNRIEGMLEITVPHSLLLRVDSVERWPSTSQPRSRSEPC